MKDRLIRLVDVVGPVCVDTNKGHEVARLISRAISAGERVRVSFAGVEHTTVAFMNHAFGVLYGALDADEIRAHMAPPEDASDRQLSQLKMSVDNGKKFFAERKRIRERSILMTDAMKLIDGTDEKLAEFDRILDSIAHERTDEQYLRYIEATRELSHKVHALFVSRAARGAGAP